jgi:hypothetical protein
MGRLTQFFGYNGSNKSYHMAKNLGWFYYTTELKRLRDKHGKPSVYSELYKKEMARGISMKEFGQKLKEKGYDRETKKWDSPEAEKAYFDNIKKNTAEKWEPKVKFDSDVWDVSKSNLDVNPFIDFNFENEPPQ